ncbi:hypothetical protein EDI_238680 [Entamoeba dispar SAW760]|uniref:Uncharacterized protein n=1 Tax=Entamoeba dispar (strain ATCC PRA-260 / SAW760) TaxID=370354 RepID=B0E6A8_ENTDS|nr:uncharacterized protein EDI_238680 [Entamoeba dispar SAW760]EDR29938.1 hypothetical protein EDI_238680 [Entamoeba dispar SAW760]|eukprot:EDR29938.1 hypothetical protein EDI_238680 [Entamoeba dispar SAW760]
MIKVGQERPKEKKKVHEEYIFAQWGLIVKYAILKGGKFEILRPKRKHYIDRRNQLDIIFAEVDGQCYKAEDIFQRASSYVKQLCEKGELKKRDKARTERKIVHDTLMNKLTKWCCTRSETDDIKIKYRKGKSSYKKKEKESNLVIYELEVDGLTYERSFIRYNFGNWMQRTLKYLFDKNKDKSITISSNNLPQEFLQDFITPCYEQNTTVDDVVEPLIQLPSDDEKNQNFVCPQHFSPLQQLVTSPFIQPNIRELQETIQYLSPQTGCQYCPPQNSFMVFEINGTFWYFTTGNYKGNGLSNECVK